MITSPLVNRSHATKKILPVKTVVEYPLPVAGQTHEILAVSDKLLLISQQTDGSLVKVALDTKGRPTGARKWVVTNPWSGLHGLTLQSTSRGLVIWATVQFDNAILQIDPNGDDINAEPQVKRTIPIPSPAFGPHRLLEDNGNLWITCKSSSHVVRMSINKQDDHQIWAVSERPIFIAVHPTSRDVFSSLDLSSKIWHYKNDGKSGQEIAIPPERGTTPVGLVAGPNDNVWVALLGNSTTGTGTFGRINKDASIDWFTMSSTIGSTASLIHMAFDREQTGRLWMLGSSMACASSVNAIFTVDIDDISTGGTAKPRIARQNSIALPTQRSAAHRVLSHKGGLYVVELATSTLAHISGAAVGGFDDSETWDQFADYGMGVKAVHISYNNAV